MLDNTFFMGLQLGGDFFFLLNFLHEALDVVSEKLIFNYFVASNNGFGENVI